MGTETTLHSACKVCGFQPEIFHGQDIRFPDNKSMGWEYRSQCSNDNCDDSPTFTRRSAEAAFEAWDKWHLDYYKYSSLKTLEWVNGGEQQ
jgi:hypothetical protein